jgi:hypothetical protein
MKVLGFAWGELQMDEGNEIGEGGRSRTIPTRTSKGRGLDRDEVMGDEGAHQNIRGASGRGLI